MAITNTDLERVAAWCGTSGEIEVERVNAWNTFFGTDEAGPAMYGPVLGEYASRQRRFLGWFMFQATLPDGRHPAELAARRLFEGEQLDAAVRALAQARYVMAVVTAVMSGRGVILSLEEERFEIRSRAWAHFMRRDGPVLTHLVPVRAGVWLPGPGWLEWPVSIGSNMRREIRQYQPGPIEVERVLQGRSDPDTNDVERPKDLTLTEAVNRMTEAATREGRPGLIRPEAEWGALVLRHLDSRDITAYMQEIIARVDDVQDVAELNQWLALAQNIWNTTPQPDRAGRTAYELASRSSRQELEIESWHN